MDSSSLRPAGRHSAFLRRKPSFSATTCNWFITRVRICTKRCRCHSSCRRSRLAASGTQIRGKRCSIINRSNSCASWRSVFCLRTRFVRISAASPIHNSNCNSFQQTLKPAAVSAGFHPYTPPSCLERPVKLLGFIAVSQSPFGGLAGVCVHQCNLLKARMIVTTYNQHVRLLSSEPFGWSAPPKFTRAWEPTLLWNHYAQNGRTASLNDKADVETPILIECCATTPLLREMILVHAEVARNTKN